ncbi:lipopolysaccharide biosynthesis protein [Candidatus Cardinium hertigii]|nr:hypothetical protein [Candidatus Cardinium hertigii]
MDMAYCRFVYKLGRQHTFNTTITILLISSVLLSISLIIYTPQIAQITDHLSHIRYFYYITAILTLDTLLAIPYVSLRVEKKILQFLLIKFLQAFTNVFFSFILLYFPCCLISIEHSIYSCFNITIALNTLDAVFIANLLSNIATLGFLLPQFKGFRLIWNSNTVQMMWAYGSTFFFTTLFARIGEILPRLLFRRLIPSNFYATSTKEEILGSFGISSKLMLFITLGIHAFKYAAEPFFFANADRKNATKLYGQVMYLFILAACISLLLFSLNIKWIAKIIIPNTYYRNTVDTVPYLAFWHIVLGIYYNISVAFKLSNNPRYNTWINAFGSLVILVMSLLLIPIWGHWGCVYAYISGATAMTLLGYYIGQKCYPIQYHKKAFLLLLFTFLAIGKISLWPERFAFLGLGWAYLFLNITILVVFSIMGMVWYKFYE